MGYQEQCIEEDLYTDDRISVTLHGGHWRGYYWIVDTHDGKHRFEGSEEWPDRQDVIRDALAFLAQHARF